MWEGGCGGERKNYRCAHGFGLRCERMRPPLREMLKIKIPTLFSPNIRKEVWGTRLFSGSPSWRYGFTWKLTLLERIFPEEVWTWTSPLLAPAGTVAVINEPAITVKVAGVPLKRTLVAPVRLVPRILTVVPTLPEVGCVLTKGFRPTDNFV